MRSATRRSLAILPRRDRADPAGVLGRYDPLIDLLREEESVTREMYVDLDRLVSATVVGDPENS